MSDWPSRSDQAGYAMAVLLVALSVMAVMMSVVMPVWKQATQREKEAELIFRGQQYARAIGLFQRKNGPGTLPPNLAVLVDQRFLRRQYKDPISNGDFQPLLAGQAVPGAQPSSGGTAGGTTGGATTPSVAGGRVGGPVASGGPSAGAVSGGVTGVVSKSTERSIRIYNGRTHYNEWAFLYTAPAQAPGTTGTGTAPGTGPRQGGPGTAPGTGPRQGGAGTGPGGGSRPGAGGANGPGGGLFGSGRTTSPTPQPNRSGR